MAHIWWTRYNTTVSNINSILKSGSAVMLVLLKCTLSYLTQHPIHVLKSTYDNDIQSEKEYTIHEVVKVLLGFELAVAYGRIKTP